MSTLRTEFAAQSMFRLTHEMRRQLLTCHACCLVGLDSMLQTSPTHSALGWTLSARPLFGQIYCWMSPATVEQLQLWFP